jgi:hypothetical protein
MADSYMIWLSVSWGLKILVRIVNLIYLRSINYRTRIVFGVIMLVLSCLIPACVSLQYSNLGGSTEEGNILFSWHLVGYFLCCIGTSIIESTTLGYLKTFHPDLSEPWGVGITLAQFFNIPANYYTSNYDLDNSISYIYLMIGLLGSYPIIYCFDRVEKIRINKIHFNRYQGQA